MKIEPVTRNNTGQLAAEAVHVCLPYKEHALSATMHFSTELLATGVKYQSNAVRLWGIMWQFVIPTDSLYKQSIKVHH